MPRRACRKDGNHDLIRDTLGKLGWQVDETYQFAQYAPGWPDLVAYKWGRVAFIEVKGADGTLTADERTWMYAHPHVEYKILQTPGQCVTWDEERRQAWATR